MEEGERVEDQLESSVARQLGRGAVALGRTRPAVGTKEEKGLGSRSGLSFSGVTTEKNLQRFFFFLQFLSHRSYCFFN